LSLKSLPEISQVVVAPAPTIGDVVVGTVIGGAINNAITGGIGTWKFEVQHHVLELVQK